MTTEQDLSLLIRHEAAQLGIVLWRNNVGALRTETGYIRFGLANDSAQLNAKLKSSDLIGIRPVIIKPGMIGKTIGQFVAREVKRPEWVYNPDHPAQAAQAAWLTLIRRKGGDACFVQDLGSFEGIKLL